MRVSSQDNLAELGSCGAKIMDIVKLELWWTGLQILLTDESHWSTFLHTVNQDILPENRLNVTASAMTEEQLICTL